VDESGNQLTVFNRRGSRPFNQEEAARLYRHKDGTLYWVSDTPNTAPRSSTGNATGGMRR
jgi:hypothetical protein